MTENILVTPGSGATVATDEIGGVHFQRVKATFGVDGVATDVSADNPLPVTMAASSGGLTNTELRATAVPISGTVTANVSGTVPVSGTFWQATQPISGNVGVTGSVAVTGTFWQATQPVSGTVTVGNASLAVTGAFYQATQPVSGTVTANAGTGTMAVSLASLPALAAGAAVIGAVTQSGTWNVGSVTTLPALATGSNVIGALVADQTVNLTKVGGNAIATGSGVTGTGVQRVVLATDIALPTGANVIGGVTQSGTWNVGSITTLPALVAGSALVGKVGIDQTTPGTTNAVALAHIGANAILTGNGVTGTGSQRVTIASDNTAFTVNATPPTLTKATQGATGYSTQDLKDAGRAIVNVATAIAGVTAVTTEALLALNVSRDGAATSSVTTIAVTSGKRFRVTHVVVGFISTAAAVLSGRFSLRMNPSGSAAANSPIIATLPIPSGAALAQAGGSLCMTLPDGIEFSGTQQIGISQVCSAITGTIWASLIGFEY